MPANAERTSTRDGHEETTPVVAVENLQKTYDDVRAVDGVSFDVRPGEVVGLLGPNGAGKTTCLNCLLGLVEPTGGDVAVAGVDAQENPRAVHRHTAAMLEGARNIYWRLTARENLAFFAGVAGRDTDHLRDRHEELLERLNLADRADESVRKLSRGMKQKVSLATTLARDVDVVFLDEPTLGLDVESSLELRRELAALVAERNLAVVLSSHDMDVIQELCDRVVVLSDGKVVADDSVDALLEAFQTQTYEFRIERGVDETLCEELRAELERRCTVTAWEETDTGVTVTVTVDDESGLAETVSYLASANGRLARIDSVEPDLEEVFLRITGGEEP